MTSNSLPGTPQPCSDRYSFTGETMISDGGETLYQIEAIKNNPQAGIAVGDLGGWMSPSSQLLDEAWISPHARLEDHAVLSGRARLGDSASMGGEAEADSDAFIAGRSRVDGNAYVTDNSSVGADALVTDNAKLYGSSAVRGNGIACGTVILEDSASIIDDAVASGGKLTGSLVLDGTNKHYSGVLSQESSPNKTMPQGITYAEARMAKD